MYKPSIYDRISQKREAAEALARQQAEQQRLAEQAAAAVVQAPPVLELAPEQNALRIAGLNLLIAQSFAFRDIQTTLERAGCHVSFGARRRAAPEGLDLSKAIELFTKKLRERHAEMTVVRQAESLLAGHPAISLDYQFYDGPERRHGRAVCAIIVSADGNTRHWLDVSTVIDPSQSLLAEWLIEFDAMLAGMTAQ